MNTGCQIGGAVTASLTPYLAGRYGWNSAFIFAALLAVVGGLLCVMVDPGRQNSTIPRTRGTTKS